MACITGHVGNVFFTRWQSVQAADVNKILWEVSKAHATVGKLMVYVSIVPTDSEPPTAEVRQAFSTALKSLNEHLCMNIMVLEGDGLRKSLKRTIASAMILLSGASDKSAIVDNVGDALARAKTHIGEPPESILQRARAQGFFS
jgi:hypothetical protein